MPWYKPQVHDIPSEVEKPARQNSGDDVPVNDKAVEAGGPITSTEPRNPESDSIDSNVQGGVKKAQATATVWTKRDILIVYVLIWVLYFVDAMQQGTTNALTPYVTSSFQEHSLTASTSIMSSIIGGLWKLPLAKVMDIFGRPQGFLISTIMLVLGLVMMAGCKNVETYAAAQVFYWIGYDSISYVISVFIADTTHLKNRGFMLAFTSSPYIATVWVTGPMATAYLKGPGFRWSFGSFAIIELAVCLPLWAVFTLNYRKAVKQGVIVPTKTERTFPQAVKYYLIEFDAFGILLVTAGMALFLLPFSLYSYQKEGWKSAMIICMLVFGFLLLIAFALYERFVAPKTFMPFWMLKDRTVFGACSLGGIVFISFYIWDAYFSSFLQVVQGLSITQATYIGNIYSIGSCFWSFVVGALIRYTGRFKWMALYFGVPVTILGVGLMVHFRQPDVNIGYIIMCQIFIAFAGGTIVITEQIAAMAAVDHQHIAVVLALEALFTSIGNAIGSSVASAVWTGVFPVKLAEYLPAETKGNATMIYASLVTQLSYPKGTETRTAIERAYGDAQRDMLIGGTAILALAIVAVMMWRDIKVKDFKQVKGNVI